MVPKRVKITYSVEFEEVLEEVARFMGAKGRPALMQADELLNQASSALAKGAALSSIEHIKEARDILAGVDYLLGDSMGILLGYINTKSSDNRQELSEQPQETHGQTDEDG